MVEDKSSLALGLLEPHDPSNSPPQGNSFKLGEVRSAVVVIAEGLPDWEVVLASEVSSEDLLDFDSTISDVRIQNELLMIFNLLVAQAHRVHQALRLEGEAQLRSHAEQSAHCLKVGVSADEVALHELLNYDGCPSGSRETRERVRVQRLHGEGLLVVVVGREGFDLSIRDPVVVLQVLD